MADPNGSLLELRHINQIYGGGEQTFTAIQDVTLALKEGEFATLMGPTGCGKSTLLRIITGLQAPTAGEVLYRGKPLHGVNPHCHHRLPDLCPVPLADGPGKRRSGPQGPGRAP